MGHPRQSKVFLPLDLVVTLAAFLAWYSAFQSRAEWIKPVCLAQPDQCQLKTLNRLDQAGVIFEYHRFADQLSYWTQYSAGFLALICFVLFRRSFSKFLGQTLLLLQCTALNGTIMELTRLIVQRPRPFVYLNPTQQGGAVANYTSFYSGHTSFAALASMMAIVITLEKPNPFKGVVLSLGVFLTLSTGALRVISGRHFVTDVLVGALAGTLIALAVNRLHRNSQ